MMLKVETLAIALCVFSFTGIAMYAVDILISRNRQFDTTGRCYKKKYTSMRRSCPYSWWLSIIPNLSF